MPKNRVTQVELNKVLQYLMKDAEKEGSITERLSEVEADVKKLDRVVIRGSGNGKVGLFEQTLAMDSELKSLRRQLEDLSKVKVEPVAPVVVKRFTGGEIVLIWTTAITALSGLILGIVQAIWGAGGVAK